MAMTRSIMHPTDFSPASRPAFRKAIELAKALGGQLALVHILPPVLVPTVGAETYISPITYEQIERTARETATRHLRRLATAARKAGARTSTYLIEGAPVADRIVRAAKVRRAGMIVMGTHGRTGVTRLMLGSVASRVVATAPCPVLTVRSRSR
jgi:nucleotide-binding universal stress UspA family protein